MKIIIVITFLITSLSCNQNDPKSSHQTSDTSMTAISRNSILSSKENKSRDSTQVFAEQILAGEIRPSDNQQTFNCLDSLTSKNEATRKFYFTVFKKIASKSDGALSEIITSYVKSYLQTYPFEFIEHYKNMPQSERMRMIDFIVYEFYASGEDYQAELNKYFSNVNKKCSECSVKDKQLLEKIKATIYTSVKRQNE